jgi:hypothetical protein
MLFWSLTVLNYYLFKNILLIIINKFNYSTNILTQTNHKRKNKKKHRSKSIIESDTYEMLKSNLFGKSF